jgi:hypothetical protein
MIPGLVGFLLGVFAVAALRKLYPRHPSEETGRRGPRGVPIPDIVDIASEA